MILASLVPGSGSSSLNIRSDDKRRLDRLRPELAARRGRRITQQELVSELITLGEREKDRLAGWRPLSAAERRKLMRVPMATGDTRGEADIDEDVNGSGS